MRGKGMSKSTGWEVYVLRCADDTLYTGIARDAHQRAEEHNGGGPRCARYTRPRRPVTLVYVEGVPDRGSACRREHEIKSLPRAAKLALIDAANRASAPRKRRAQRRCP